MKTYVAVTALTLSFLVGCSHVKETKETVVEKPTTVVEKPVVIKSYRSCTTGSATYSHGSLSCQNGYQYRCNDGTWDGLNVAC